MGMMGRAEPGLEMSSSPDCFSRGATDGVSREGVADSGLGAESESKGLFPWPGYWWVLGPGHTGKGQTQPSPRNTFGVSFPTCS